MTCKSSERFELRQAAQRLVLNDCIVNVDVLDPSDSRFGRWTIEATVSPASRGIPVRVFDEIEEPLRVREVGRQGLHYQFALTF